jgi:hypothetical protein
VTAGAGDPKSIGAGSAAGAVAVELAGADVDVAVVTEGAVAFRRLGVACFAGICRCVGM